MRCDEEWLVRFENRTHVFECGEEEILRKLSLRTGWGQERLEIRSVARPFCSVRLISSLRGGKGGFGTLLKGQSKQAGAKLTVDFGACRDLQGRRLRHVNDEIALRKWREFQQMKKDGQEVDDHYLSKTPSGIYNWHLMLPAWAAISGKATHKLQRNLKRQWDIIDAQTKKRQDIHTEREERYQQGVDEYLRQTATATESLKISNAVAMGLAANKRKREQHQQQKEIDKDTQTQTEKIHGTEPNSLITLSGDLVVEELDKGWSLQSQSDFGTMSVLLAGKPDSTNTLYWEVFLETGGLAQIGWADMTQFKPNTETGDGAGDDGASYAFDPSRRLKFHNGNEGRYGHSLSKSVEVIIGCLYDIGKKTLSYTCNGEDLGLAFQLEQALLLVPVVSCNKNEIVELHLKKHQMKFMPAHCVPIEQLMEKGVPSLQSSDHKTAVPPNDDRESTTFTVKNHLQAKDAEPPSKKPKIENPEPLDLNSYHSIEELMLLGMDRLKIALSSIQCKCGGSLEERAKRLYSLKGLERKDYPKKARARNFEVWR